MRVRALALALTLLLLAAAGCGSGDDGDDGAAGTTAETSAELGEQLRAAARSNRVADARTAIEQGANVNAKDARQQTALHYAAGEGAPDPAVVELLLEHEADVHALDEQGSTPLIRAARRGHPELVEPLLEADSDVDHVNRLGWTALLETVIFGDGSEPYAETVRLLVDAGADPAIGDIHGVPPRGHAELAGQTEVAAILREAERSR